MGETLRRLVSKAAAARLGNQFQASLEPIQLGVGSKGGCETIAHSVQAWFAKCRDAPLSHGDRVLLNLDLANAFNTLDREAMLLATRRLAPSLSPWVETCYRAPTHLSFGPFPISSESGVQQGDPLGPALFALTLQDAVVQSLAEADNAGRPLDLCAFYLDDGVICGTQKAVAAFASSLKSRLSVLGLSLAADKRDVYPAVPEVATIDPALFPGYNIHDLPNFTCR